MEIEFIFQVLVFIIILFLAGFFYKRVVVAGKFSVKHSKHIELIDKYYLANDKWIEIIKIGEKTLVLGVTQSSITELREIAQEELHEIQQNNDNFFGSVLKKHLNKQKQN